MSYIKMAKLLVPAGAFDHFSCGETFLPGQGQMAGLRGEQARLGSSAPNRTGIRIPSLIEVEVTVKKGAAVRGAAHSAAARPKTRLLLRRIVHPLVIVGDSLAVRLEPGK